MRASVPLFLVTLLSIIPFYFIISLATHSTSEIYRGDILVTGNYFIKNMGTIIKGGFMRYYQNSIIAALFSTLLCLFISSLAAYGITIYQFKAKKFMTAFIFTSMMIPGQIGIIGYVIEMRNLHLTDSLLGIILVWGASSYAVYFLMQYMRTGIPIELVESARIDGCGELKTYFMIGLPMIRPAIGALSMLCFLWSWNNLLLPSTLLNKSAMFTIPIGIQTLATAYTQDWGARAAALAIAILPIIAIFSIGSKYFIQGLSAGAIKG
jgi:multiple sugar transport system permease protein/cellobiose transport system permease protein